MLAVILEWRPFGRHFYIVENIMKQIKCSVFLLPSLLALVLSAGTTVQADITGGESRYKANNKANYQVKNQTGANTGQAITVNYDKANDRLSVNADSVSLMSVLGRIAQKSGIEVLFDDQADETVSVDIQSESLEQALKRLLKGRNHSMRYSRDSQQKLLLVGVMVLPAGEQNSGRARRLMSIEHEAYYRASNPLSLEQQHKMDLANERWQARLSEFPPARREMLEKQVAARLRKQAERDQRRAEKRKIDKQMSAQKKAERLKRREARYEGLDQEQRAAIEQRGNEAREHMKSILLDGNN